MSYVFLHRNWYNDNVHLAHKHLCIYVGLSVFKDFYVFDFFFLFVLIYCKLSALLILIYNFVFVIESGICGAFQKVCYVCCQVKDHSKCGTN